MRICFFGDSFANGTGDDECRGWVGRACATARKRGHDLTVYNLGIRRDTSADILRRWQGEARARLPDECEPRLVFAFGNNDAAVGDDGQQPRLQAHETLANAESILRTAKAWCPTLMIGPVPKDVGSEWADRVRALSADLESLCAETQVPYLDLFQLPEDFWTSWRAEAQRGDGVHPNSQGYDALAAHIQRWAPWQSWFE